MPVSYTHLRQGVCNHANLLTGKLWCTECGQPYYRRESEDKSGRKNSKWLCSGKIKNGADSCKSFAIYESEIKPLLFEVFRDTAADADAMVEDVYKRQGRCSTPWIPSGAAATMLPCWTL